MRVEYEKLVKSVEQLGIFQEQRGGRQIDTTMLASEYMRLQAEQVVEHIVHSGNTYGQHGGDLQLLGDDTNLVEQWGQRLYIKIVKEWLKVPRRFGGKICIPNVSPST